MSKIGNFLVGAGAGLGAAAAQLGSKYIDDEIARNRAQALADIQHQTMVRGEEYLQSPEVQGRRQSNERSALEMRSEQSLAAEVAKTNNKDLRQAKIDERVGYLQGTTQAEIDAKNAVTEGTAGVELDKERMRAKVMTPLEIERARGVADAQWGARAQYDERLEGKTGAGAGKAAKMSEAGKLQLQDINKQDEALQKAVNDGVAGGTLKQDPKDPAWQHFTRQKQALQVQKMRVFAREGLLDGADDAATLIAGGATPQDLDASMKQAQLIGGNYASEFGAAVQEHAAKAKPQRAAPTGAPAAATPAPASVIEQRRAERQPAPAGSPQAKWDARQQELRAQAEAKDAGSKAQMDSARQAFDTDAKAMDPVDLLRKYGTPSSRAALDLTRLARLNQIERTIR